MAKSRKTGIRLSLEQALFPALAARGFAAAGEWGRFQRRATGGTETLELDFHKNNRAHFRVTLEVNADSPGSHWLEGRHFYLTRWGLPLRRWFGVRKKVREGIAEEEYDACVAQVIARLPEVDRLFAHGKRSWRLAEMPEPRWVGWVLISFWGSLVLAGLVSFFLGWIAGLRALRGFFAD